MRRASSLRFWEALKLFPPIMVRLSARRTVAGKNVRALSRTEIAITSDIPLTRVMEISRAFSWDEVTIGEAERFCQACGFDPTVAVHRERQREYIRSCQTNKPGRPPHYLQCSPWWETEFLPLIQLLKSRTTSSDDSRPSPSAAVRSAA